MRHLIDFNAVQSRTIDRLICMAVAIILSAVSLADAPKELFGIRLASKVPDAEVPESKTANYLSFSARPSECQKLLDFQQYKYHATLLSRTVTSVSAGYVTKSEEDAKAYTGRVIAWLEKTYARECETFDVGNAQRKVWVMKFEFGTLKKDFKTYFLVERNNPMPGLYLVLLSLYNSDLSALADTEAAAASGSPKIPSGNGELSDEQVSRDNKELEGKVREGVGELKNGWSRVEIPGYMSLAMPPTMEIQGGKYKTVKNAIAKQVLNFNMDTDTLTLQQAGLNDYMQGSTRRYARIIVKNIKGDRDAFWKMDDPVDLSPAELKELDQDNYKEMRKAIDAMCAMGNKAKLLRWYPFRVEKFGGGTALCLSYLRQNGENPPVLVEQYKVGNNDVMHIVTFSYRQNEADYWKADFEEIKKSVKFQRR